ncbi:MAG: ATP-binding protein [bacterium]|nr:ATP-binding protein [bacterium]
MYRHALEELEQWRDRPGRKPLIIRGARQVGKTTLVRLFAEQHFAELVEVNFERNPELAELFDFKDPTDIPRRLELQLGQDVTPGRSLLFLDEIQAAPRVLATLRYLYEELPRLHVIAAGSLLDLALDQPAFSVPVGRIEYLHLGPMRFEELLLAAGQDRLVAFLQEYELGEEIHPPLHEQLMRWLRTFLVVGGMPDAVRAFVERGAHQDSEAVKHSVLATFRDDFGKYGARVDHTRLRKVFERLPLLVGDKLKYVHIDRGERAKDLSAALHLLSLARVAYRVRHTAANGVPLGAEADERKFKVLFLDVGLMATASGLSVLDLEKAEDVMMVNRGALCEQLVGQHLLYRAPSWEEPRLFYWAREKRGSAAEVDYVISQGAEILPIEVKAGKTGTLKSLHLFLREKSRSLAVRLSSAPPSVLAATTSLADGRNVPFQLVSLPLYLVGQVRRLCGGLAR